MQLQVILCIFKGWQEALDKEIFQINLEIKLTPK